LRGSGITDARYLKVLQDGMSATQKTPMLSRIIVPHDENRASDRALDKAIEFAKAFGSEVVLVNIVDDRFIPPSTTLAFLNYKTSLEQAKMKVTTFLKQASEAMWKDKLEKVKFYTQQYTYYFCN
jgi:nucleotide-binding universal stress UspA family protein